MPLEKSSDAEHRALKRVVDDLDSRLARCNSMLERAETLMQSKNKELAEKASKKRADLMTAIEDIKKFQLPEARKELGRYEEKMREVDALVGD
jgi:phage-related protein